MFKSTEFKVGFLVVVVTTIIAALTLKVSDGPGLFSGVKRYWFVIDNASGLVPNSAVRMAGIRVGQIESIELQGGRARVNIAINDNVDFTEDGSVQVRPQGLLGDKIVELNPGPVGGKALKEGSQILKAADRGSIDDVVGQFGEISKSLSDLGKALSEATTGDGDKNSPIGRIITNIEEATKDLAEITRDNKGKVGDILDRVSDITQTLNDVINSEGSKGFKPSWNKIATSIDNLNVTMENLADVSKKINSGQGTLGRLINDDEIAEKVNTTMDSVNEFLGNAGDLETSIGYHGEYFSQADITKSYVDIKIQPGLDRYYLIQIVSDPLGLSKNTSTTTTINNGAPTEEDKTVLDKSALKYSILFAKNFYNFTLKGGIMESSGGVGVDYYMLRRKLKWSLDLYEFNDLNVKTYIKYDVWKGVYILAGANDLADKDNFSAFLGAGLFITNDDLKMFASKVSF